LKPVLVIASSKQASALAPLELTPPASGYRSTPLQAGRLVLGVRCARRQLLYHLFEVESRRFLSRRELGERLQPLPDEGLCRDEQITSKYGQRSRDAGHETPANQTLLLGVLVMIVVW
jgi:hypothetical protein